MPDLGAYLRDAAARPFDWGMHDCCTFPGDWVLAVRGDDPVERWRGSYASQEDALELIEDAGGIGRLWEIGLRGIGLSPMRNGDGYPIAGDVGIVMVVSPHGISAHGGICTGKRWSFLSNVGIITFSAEPSMFWRP